MGAVRVAGKWQREPGAALPEVGVLDQPVIKIGIHEIRVQLQSDPADSVSLFGQQPFN